MDCSSQPVRLRRVELVSAIAAAVVPLYVLVLISRSSRFIVFDYFEKVPRYMKPSGGLIWSGLFEHQNDHLTVIPNLVAAVNIWLFAGSNLTLGIAVWIVALGLAAVFFWLIRADGSTSGWSRVLVIWLVAVYVFPLAAQQNFRLATSGLAWITANLLAVVAIVLLVRDRPTWSGLSGFAATMTYGTGLALWPALLLIMGVRRRFRWGEAMLVVFGSLSVMIYRSTAGGSSQSIAMWNPLTIARSVGLSIGALFVSDSDARDVALLIGVGCVVLGVGAVLGLVSQLKERYVLTVFGVAIYAAGALVLFGISRSFLGENALFTSRYSAVVALFMLAVSLLVLKVSGFSLRSRILVSGLAVVSLLASVPAIDRFEQLDFRRDLDMTAVSMGVGVGVVPLYSELTDEVFRGVGHIPFGNHTARDCGLYRQEIDAGLLRSDRDLVVGTIEAAQEPAAGSAILKPVEVETVAGLSVRGTVAVRGAIDCILVVDDQLVVSGLALPSRSLISRTPPTFSWSGYMLRGTEHPEVVVRLKGSEEFFVLGSIPA